MQRETVLFLSKLLHAERRRRGTRKGRRALGCFTQAVLILRWFLDGTRLAQLAADNAISVKTVYRYLHEGIDVLAAHAPDLRDVLAAATRAGLSHVNVDGVPNKLIWAIPGIGERGNALLIVRFKALRRVSLDLWRIGAITFAALVLLDQENDRTV
jgi:hypothetical protein